MIKILEYTRKPLTTVGQYAGVCYGQRNEARFRKIGERCINENHGRVQEFADIVFEFDGTSAKVVRELFRHKHASELQSSTRYIDYSKGFHEIVPLSVKTNRAIEAWNTHSEITAETMNILKEEGVPVEDLTNKLPLSYTTNGVYKINLRSLSHMFGVRLCTCAYHEYRKIMLEIKKAVSELDEEWKWIADKLFVQKCINDLYCSEEARHCGLRPKKSDVEKLLKENGFIK
ncbi:MAG: FAD-dependent thymidylate synthase [Cetobacterium sp.]